MTLLALLLFPSTSDGQRQTRRTDSYQGVTLRAHQRLERRVVAMEARMKVLIDTLESLTAPVEPLPAIDAKQRPSNPKKQRPREVTPVPVPARAPPISITWKPRDGRSTSFVFPAGESVELKRDDIGFRCYTTTTPELNAWMITVAAINGYKDRGVAYFEDLTIRANGAELESLKGRHVILPRGAILRRFYLGPDADEMRELQWVDDPRPYPVWAPSASLAALKKSKAQVGPYSFHWGYKSLSNSHGGQGVAPFHGGPDDWLTCGEGRRLREKEMLSEYQRPIWLLGPLPQEPYWMGRTMAHRLQGYDDDPDDWCEYAQRLNEWRPADHTHLSRTTGAPAAMAGWDLLAKDCLLMSWKDFKAANSLTRPKELGIFDKARWPLWAKIEVAEGPINSEGDRAIAHWLRLMRWVRPYVDASELGPYEDAYRLWIGRMEGAYGITYAMDPQPSGIGPPVDAPSVQAFHLQLNLFEFQRFGGLDEIAEKLAAHLTPSPGWYFEYRYGMPGDTILDRDNSKKSGYPPYGTMTHGVLQGYTSPTALLKDSAYRGPNGSSQDLDCIPRSIWEQGLVVPPKVK